MDFLSITILPSGKISMDCLLSRSCVDCEYFEICDLISGIIVLKNKEIELKGEE